ncbi:hypothetical protein OG900_35325 [Streptomyces sp. NBC_00433]
MTGQSGPRRPRKSRPDPGPEAEPGPKPQPRPKPPPRHLPKLPRQPPTEPPPAAEPPVPRRVAVSAPRRHRTGGYSARPGAADLHAQPQLGQLYVRSLVRNQLRLSLGVLAVLAAVLGGLPLALALLPALRTAEVAGIRLPWLLLGVVAYPLLVGAAYFHVRHAERVEGDFTDLLGGPDAPPPAPPRAAR